MAAGTLGEAVVEILADIGSFDEDVRRQLQQSADAAAERVQRDLDQINAAAAESGRRLAESLGGGADQAADSIGRMTRLGEEAAQAFRDLDADALARIQAEAENTRREFLDLARAARAAEGAFAGMDPAELEGIARAAEDAARQTNDVGRQAQEAQRVLAQFRGEELERLAREAQDAADRLQRLSRTPLRRLAGEARDAGRAILLAFRGSAAAAAAALRRVDSQNFNRLVGSAVRAALAIRAAFDAARRDADFDSAGKRAVTALRSIATAGLRLAVVGSQLASLVAVVGAVAAALAPTVGILAGLPATVLLAAGALATLKVGLSGIGDAFKAAVGTDAKAFEASIKNLAPSAQKVAKEVRALKPALDGLKNSVQGALFKPLIGQLTAVARNLGGPLRAGMTATAAQFGRLGRAATDFGKSASAVKLVGGVFGTLKAQIAGIKSGTITGLLDAVARFTTSTLPGFAGIGSSLDSALKRLTGFLDRAATGGQALRWLEAGKAQFRQLGAVAGDVASILGTVFASIQQASGGALGQLKILTGTVREFVDQAAQSGQLTQIFQAINATAAAAAPALGALLRGLAAIAPIVQDLSTRLGPILTQAITGLVPAIQGVLTGLVPVFDQLGQAINTLATGGGLTAFGQAVGDLLAALAPLLPTLAAIINSGLLVLSPILSGLAPVLEAVANALRAIAESPLGPFLGVLAAQFAVVFAVTGSAGLAFRSLLPTLRLTGTVLRLVGQAVLFLGRALISAIIANPVVAAIVAIIAVIVIAYLKVKVFRDAVNAIGAALLTAGKAILGFGKSLVEAFQAGGISGLIAKIGSSLGNLGGLIGQGLGKVGSVIASGLGTAFSAVISFFAGLPGKAVSALATFGPVVLAAIASGLTSAITFLASWSVKFLIFFLTLPFKIAAALLQFGPTILGAIASGLGAVLLFIGNFIVQVLAFFITLPFRILGALLSLALFLKQPFITGVTAVISFLGTAITAIINFFVALPGRIVAGLIALPGLLRAAAVSAWNSFKNATISATLATIAFVRALPGRVLAGLSALGSFLSRAASNAWNAFKARTIAGVQAAIAFIRTLPGKALAALNNFTARMGQLGRDIMTGLINGIKSLAGNLLSSITGPINDAIGKAKSLLGIGSPSKVFHAIGSDTLQGFINGTTKKAKAAAAVFRRLVADVIAITGRGFVKGLTGNTTKITSTIEKLVKAITKAFRGKKTNLDEVLIKQLDATNKRLQGLAKKRTALADLFKKATEFATSTTQAARDFGAITNVTANDSGVLTGAGVAAQLEDRLKRIKKFQSDLAALTKRGLNKASLEQIVSQGIEQGGALASALADSSNTTLNQINDTTKAINTAAAKLGKSTADLFFDSGKNAGKGFLEGIKGQQSEITKLMTKIAKDAAAAVRKTLKIKSPSKVMEGLGAFTIEGFLQGIGGLAPEVERALESAVRVRDALARQLEANVSTGAVGSSAAAGTPAALTAPATTGGDLAALVDALNRLVASGAGGALGKQVEVNAPITVNLPVADPNAVGQVVSSRVASIANR